MAIRLVFNPQRGWQGAVRSKPITWREMNILAMLAQGNSNQEIADMLGIKYQTVKNNIYRLTQKLGAKNNAHALILAINARLITLEVISDDMDESLPKEKRDKARLHSMQDIDKVSKMGEEEAEIYMAEENQKALGIRKRKKSSQ